MLVDVAAERAVVNGYAQANGGGADRRQEAVALLISSPAFQVH